MIETMGMMMRTRIQKLSHNSSEGSSTLRLFHKRPGMYTNFTGGIKQTA